MNVRHTWSPWWARIATMTLLFLLAWAGTSTADNWNDRTRLRFSSEVMVPGTTLPPGEYVFELLDLKANRHVVQIRNGDESKVLAIAHAVPVKRRDTKGTTTLTFNPTATGMPPALKAWYYPGSIYGHEFIYPENEARMIAQRDKTIVLSEQRATGDADAAGTLRQYDADGAASDWRADEAVIREWAAWSKDAVSRARTATDARTDRDTRRATTSMVDSAGTAMKVRVDDLETRGRDYTGKTISVDAEVEKVLGPRLFTIDEPDWADLDGEVLVHVPTALATLVRPDDRVTVTGTIRAYATGELDSEWRWFQDGGSTVSEWTRRPILVATRVVGGDDDRALLITHQPTATASNRSASPVLTLNDVTADAAGRPVDLERVEVRDVVPGHGFFVTSGTRTLFVRPERGQMTGVKSGQMVSIEGYVLTLPPGVTDEAFGDTGSGGRLYVFATDVS